MALSVFDLFKIGIGPSSSHTVGPMCAALPFVEILMARGLLEQVARVRADLYGSLALTGRGHATDTAVLLGLSGERPATVNPDATRPRHRGNAADGHRHAGQLQGDVAGGLAVNLVNC